MQAHRPNSQRRRRAHGGSAGALPVVVAPRRHDPLWTRVGALVLAGLALAPLAAALGRDRPVLEGQPTGGAIAIVQPAARAATASTPVPATAALDDAGAAAPSPATERSGALTQGALTQEVPAIDEPAAVAQPDEAEADRQDVCELTYEVQTGDYWFGIADRAEVSAYELATINGATLERALYPGDVLCLPAGARYPVPPPPTTPAPSTTAAPRPAPPPSTTPPPASTATTATTQAPPASSGRSPQSYGADEVKDIIRFVFPDDQEQRAIDIAWRESNWKPWVYNGHCCYGLFQIYWSVHRGWLDDLGIDSAQDLLDPWLNAQAAYALFQRSGNSWAPWGG